MKKILFIAAVLFTAVVAEAQSSVYDKLSLVIRQKFPSVQLQDKLLAVNVWQVKDAESREANKNFMKTVKTYEVARLRGGSKGMVAVLVSMDELSKEALIAVQRDGVEQLMQIRLSDIPELSSSGFRNAVFDSSGNEILRNIGPAQIFQQINQLITR